MISKTENPLSCIGRWIKGKVSKKVIISFTTILLLIILLLVCTGAKQSSKENNSNRDVKTTQERVKAIINNHIEEIKSLGYENVTAEETSIVKISNENHISLMHNLTDNTLENIIIHRYEYFAIYYSININNKALLFKSQTEANNFLTAIKKYDNKNYEIKTIKELVYKETNEEDLNKIISTKKNDYIRQQYSLQEISYESLNDLQIYAHDLIINIYGWTEEDFIALVHLWNRESGWNPNSHNSSSGAHGIPQALPADKMASEGEDYYTNGYTQIRWGIKYIQGRYGSPLNAWAHFQNKGWY